MIRGFPMSTYIFDEAWDPERQRYTGLEPGLGVLDSGTVDASEFDEARARLDDPAFTTISAIAMACGRRPGGAA